MNNLLLLAAQNTVLALVLALLIYGLTRLWRNPPVAHVLWLLVLLKLMAPPMIYIGWPAIALPESTRPSAPTVGDAPAERRAKNSKRS